MSHSPARALDVGSVIAGTYTIEGLLGKGGMGAVFIASHARLPGKKVAVKVLHPDVADGDSMARFKREAEIASRLGHANIVEVHDWNQLPDGTPYIVYELLDGEALSDRLRRGPMPLEEVMSVARQVGSALAAAHREHIVHRDLKPQNIFLVAADDGVSMKAKVLDFGISKIRGSTTVKTQDTAMLGTPQYMAPEQAMGRQEEVDGRTDVFAFGAVVYEMLAGVPAFQGATIPEVVFKVVYEETPDLAARAPHAPPHVVAAVHKALAKKNDERWPDVSTFIEALTGSPLQSGKRSVVSMTAQQGIATGTGTGTGAGGSLARSGSQTAKNTGHDAMAATMGSGDHASAMAASHRASMAAAQTVASSTAQSANASIGTPQVVTVQQGKSKVVMIVTVVAVLAAAVVAVVVVSGGGKGSGGTVAGGPGERGGGETAGGGSSSGSSVALIAPIDAGAIPTAVDAPPPIDAAAKKPKIDAGASDPLDPRNADPPRPPDPPPAEDEESDPKLRDMIASARQALADDPEEAVAITKKIHRDFPKAQAAWAIRAQALCSLEDQEAARAAARRLSRPALKRAVRGHCSKHGIEL